MDTETQSEEQVYPISEQSKWLVTSALLHGFGIAIAALMTVVIEMPSDDKPVLLSTEFYPDERTVRNDPLVTIDALTVPTPVTEPLDAGILVNVASQHVEDAVQLAEHSLESQIRKAEANPDCVVEFEASSPALPPVLDTEFLIGPGESVFAPKPDLWGTSNSRQAGLCGSYSHLATYGPQFTAFSSYTRPRIIRCYFHCNQKEASSIDWLAKHQEPDGSWSSTKHGASVKSDTAVTGLALLALLSNGNTEKFGRQKESVQRAVAWLMSKQNADGMIWDSSDDGAGHRAKGYPCAIASIALIEAGGMANIPATRAAGQKAIDYICNVHQSSSGGWRYAPGNAGDLSVTGWYVMALKSAKVCGFTVPEGAFVRALSFVDKLEVKETAADGVGYSRYKYSRTDDHLESAHRLTAIGTVVRQFTGTKSEELQTTTDWFVASGGLPTYGTNGDKVDLYYWYYGSLALHQQHRVQPELWTQWCESMLSALGPSQCTQGDDFGSWDPVGAYSNEWGRVGQTALSTLCLATWHRYRVMDNK